MPDIFEQLLVFVLALSLVTERFVNLVKTLPYLDWVAESPNSVDLSKPKGKERGRQLVVQLVAMLGSWLALSLMDGNFGLLGPYPVAGHSYPRWFLIFLGTGGSSFWSQLLGLTRAARDLRRVATVEAARVTTGGATDNNAGAAATIRNGKFVPAVAE